jgi:hypothetical protein
LRKRIISAAVVTVFGVSSLAYGQGAKPTAAPAKPAGQPAAPAKPAGQAAPAKPAPAPAKPAGQAAAPAKPAGQAAAPAKPAAAKDPFVEGEKLFKANDFAGALASFKEVKLADLPKDVAQKRTPLLARYTAICEDKTGGLRDAALHYEQFVAMAPKNMSKEAEEAKKRAEEIKAMPARLNFTANVEGAEVYADDKLLGKTPLEASLPAGQHKLRIVAEGREPWSGDADLGYASTGNVHVDLVAPPPPPAPVAEQPVTPPPPPPAQPKQTEAPPEPKSKLPAYITGGVAVVALGVGTAFGIKALGHQSDFDKNPTEDNANSGENSALIADMALGVAITFGITSAVLFFTNDDAPSKSAARNTWKLGAAKPPVKASKPITIVPVPVIHQNGGGAGAVVRF